MKAFPPLAALVLGAFAFGTTEFAPMGLLPEIASGVHVSIPKAGMIVTAYAVGVMIGAPTIMLALSGMPRKSALVLLMAVFVAGNVMTGTVPGYLGVMAARFVTSLGQGAFFGLGSIVAASLVSEGEKARAVAVMFLGLAIANIAGVATATWIGHQLGWRTAFLAIGGLGVVSVALLLILLPETKADHGVGVRDELRVLISRPVLAALATTALAASAMFTLYTYITPVLTDLTHPSSHFIEAMLILIGVAFTIGNQIGGRAADRSLDGSLIASLVVIAVVMSLIPLVATTRTGAAIMLFCWGMAFFAATPAMQLKVMSAAKQAPALASSVNIGAFNFGNAIGAAAGGATLTAGLGYRAIPLVGAALALCATAAAILNRSGGKRAK